MIIFYDGFLYEFFYLPPIHSRVSNKPAHTQDRPALSF